MNKVIRLCLVISVFVYFLIPDQILAQGPLYSSESLLYEYPVTEITLNGRPYSTPEMRYVDQFLNDDGSETALGDKLIKWLSMEETDDRTNSGYLMLEQEYLHQVDNQWRYQFVWAAEFVGETIGSMGLNLAGAGVEEFIASGKFGKAGKSVLPYYQALQEIYFQYVEAIQKEVEEIKKGAEVAYDIVKSVAEVYANEKGIAIGGEASPLVATWIAKNKKDVDTFVLSRRDSHNYKGYSVQTVNNGIMECKDARGEIVNFTGMDIKQAAEKGEALIFDFSKMGDSDYTKGIHFIETNVDAINVNKGIKEATRVTHIETCLQQMEASGILSELDGTDKGAITRWRKWVNEDITNNDVSKGDLAGDAIAAVSSWYNYYQKNENITAQQNAYYTAIATISVEYINMLEEWRESMSPYKDYAIYEDMMAAVDTVISDIEHARDGTLNEITDRIKRDAFHLTGEELFDAVYNSTYFITDFMYALGIKADPLFKLSKLKDVGTVTGVVGIGTLVGSMLLDTDSYLDFNKNVTALYGLKHSCTSLVFSLINKYGKERTHDNARMVIDALNTLKELKLAGEELVSVYYLSDLYGDIGIDDLAKVQAVFWNEMFTHGLDYDFDIEKSCFPVRHYIKYNRTTGATSLGYYAINTTDSYRHQGVELRLPPEEILAWPQKGRLPVNLGPNINAETGTNIRYISIDDIGTVDAEDPAWRRNDVPKLSITDYVWSRNEYVYQCNGADIALTKEEYETCIEIAEKIGNTLYMKSRLPNDTECQLHWKELKDEGKALDLKEQTVRRLMWTDLTHAYIESFLMFDPTEDYYE